MIFRFAPSPNGYLHLGHAYSALLNADLAQASGGRLLLRIEDIDPARSKPEFVTAILEDLRWLGLRWEEPVRCQSRHLAGHGAALDRLAARGLLYPCFCTRGDIARATAAMPDWPRDPDGSPLYPGTCRTRPARHRDARLAGALPRAWRLDMAAALALVPPDLAWSETGADGATRSIAANPSLWADALLARKDVRTSYHVAVVVDDAAQQATDVVRGEDLFFATHLHRLLQCLLELPTPRYRHHALIRDGQGGKLAKSRLSTPLRDWRAAGASPDDIRRMVGL